VAPFKALTDTILDEAFEIFGDKSEYVVAAPQYRVAANTAMGWKNSNLRTEMTRLLRRAGVSGWPRLFHSMRASRQTELQREFPLHVVCSWLGNSPRIAQQSYLVVTEDDFAKAAGVAKVVVDVPLNLSDQRPTWASHAVAASRRVSRSGCDQGSTRTSRMVAHSLVLPA
jgi:hypothetical protein